MHYIDLVIVHGLYWSITIIYGLEWLIIVNNGSRFSSGSEATEVIAASASSANLFEQSVTGAECHLGVSTNGGTPESSTFNRIFDYKPSILGTSMAMETTFAASPSEFLGPSRVHHVPI